MDSAEMERVILEWVRRPNYSPVKSRVLAKQLQIPLDQVDDLKRVVKRLLRSGLLRYEANHRVKPGTPIASSPKTLDEELAPKADSAAPVGYLPLKTSAPKKKAEKTPGKPAGKANPSQRPGRIVGTFQRNAKGFGFVRPERPFGEAQSGKPPEDIFIPEEYAKDASTGDTVVVALSKHKGKTPGPRGEIVEILNRQTRQFVGTYFEDRGGAFVRVDGSVFARPISVGDPGAKNAQPEDKVVFEMVRFPSPYQDGEGVITEVLGARGRPGVDTLSIIREFDLPDAFPEDVLEQTREEAARFEKENFDGRVDLTGATIITIDPEDARDFDDAISLEKTEEGNWLLGVHIADVSYFVRPKTPLDREARSRATSVYLPDRVIPMLPETISNSLASLQPDKPRFTKTCYMEFTPQGLRTEIKLHNSVIKSCKRLTYEQVDGFLAEPEAWKKKLGEKVFDLLGRMRDLSRILRAKRKRNGSLELSMPEVKIELDKEGRVSGAHATENTESHKIIEEFMLSANEAVAESIRDKDWPFLRRVHQTPSPHKLKALTDFVRSLGYKVSSLESRFELQKTLLEAAERPDQRAVHFAALRSMQRAVYGPMDEGHYALASECYCHFTSPIRRYPDLTVHRLVDAILKNQKPKNDYDELMILGRHCSDREQRAESAERELTKLKLLHYLSERIGMEMDGVVTGVESYGIFVQGIAIPAEGLVRIDSLRDDTYYFDRASHTLSGRREGNEFRLGDVVKVEVSDVDLERRELDFRLAGVTAKKAAPAGETKGPTKTAPFSKTKRSASPKRAIEIGEKKKAKRAKAAGGFKKKPSKKKRK